MAAGRESVMARPAGRAAGPSRRGVQALGGVAGLLCALVGWLYLAPAQIGGATSYAVVVGSSMEPKLGADDLVLVRPQARYEAGDVVLYDDPQLRSKVLHRIVRVDDERYVLKGDNNDYLDSTQPTAEQIVGALWVTAPGVGRVTTWLREPINAGLLVGLATLVALGGGVAAGSAVSGRRRRLPARAAPRREPPTPKHLSTVLPFACVAFAILTVVAFTRPTSRLVTAEQPWANEARFAYAASVPRSPVYPDGSVSTGEPVFLRLVPRLRVDAEYRLATREPASVGGTIGMTARLSDGRGWARVLQVAPEQEFTGAVARIDGVVDLTRVQRLTEQLQALTGTSQAAYSLTLATRVTTTGEVDGRPLESTFSPSIALELADLRLQPQLDDDGSFVRRETGQGEVSVRESIRVGRAQLSVGNARWIGSIGLAVSLLAGACLVFLLGRRSPRDEPARIRERYGRVLVDVGLHAVDPRQVHDVPDIDALARIAGHHGRLILHTVDAGEHAYLVEEGETVFRYRTSAHAPA